MRYWKLFKVIFEGEGKGFIEEGLLWMENSEGVSNWCPPLSANKKAILGYRFETLNSDTLGKSCRYSWGDYDICDKYDNNCNDSDHNH